MSGERTLFEVIEARIRDMMKASVPRQDARFQYLLKLKKLWSEGVVLTSDDREFLDDLQPDRPVRRCETATARGKCPAGYGAMEDDRCPHWGNWIKSKVTCDGYEPEEYHEDRFHGG